MADRAVIAFAPLILERDDFFVLALFHNFRSDLRPGDEWAPMCYVFSVGKQQHLAEGRGLTRIDIQKIDIDRIAFHDAKLSAASLDNCVSHEPERKSRPNFHRWVGLTRGKLAQHTGARAYRLRSSFVGPGNKVSVESFVALCGGIPGKIARHRPFHQLGPELPIAEDLPRALNRIPEGFA
jgi:hypothetical protein